MSSVSLPTAPTNPNATTATRARIREYSTMAVPRSSRYWMVWPMRCAARRTAGTSLVRKEHDRHDRDEEQDQGVLNHALALLIVDPNVAIEQLLLKLLHAVQLLLLVRAQRAVLAVTGS